MNKATIVYIINEETNEVLMAKKTRKVGVGYYFGYGGKIEEGESATESTVRETFEEGGVKIYGDKLVPMALISFYRGKDETEPTFVVMFYITYTHDGIPVSTPEMADPAWFKIDDLPSEMKPGDELILNYILNGQRVKGHLRFDKETNEVLDYSIVPCDESELVI